MTLVGIICEYNPFHNGHLRQLTLARDRAGEETALVCLMSGSYVQRGEPAVFPKALRAKAAVLAGADLVLELPLTAALSSAEGFAAGGVRILTALGCDKLCFGSESGDGNMLMSTAKRNLDPEFHPLVRAYLETGISYPRARALALRDLGAELAPDRPNDILAVEYCKAILSQASPMEPLVLDRPGAYHAQALDPAAPSASALRAVLPAGGWEAAVPEKLIPLYAAAPLHSLEAGERAVLARVRTLPEEAFAALPFGSEGLWRKLRSACRTCPSVEAIVETVKSKRYSRTRIQRMLLCAYLGLTARDLETPAPYVRVLAFNDRGRSLLRVMKGRFPLVNAGQRPDRVLPAPGPGDPSPAAYYALETRAAALYSLFSRGPVDPAEAEEAQRVFYLDLA